MRCAISYCVAALALTAPIALHLCHQRSDVTRRSAALAATNRAAAIVTRWRQRGQINLDRDGATAPTDSLCIYAPAPEWDALPARDRRAVVSYLTDMTGGSPPRPARFLLIDDRGRVLAAGAAVTARDPVELQLPREKAR